MGKYKHIVLGVMLSMFLGLTGCDFWHADQDTTAPLPMEDGKHTASGAVQCIQFDGETGNLISAHVSCRIPLEAGAQTFAYVDAQGRTISENGRIQTAFSENQGTVTESWENGGLLTTHFTSNSDGSLDLTQSIQVAQQGVSGVRFRMQVPMEYALILPTWDGIRLDKEHPEIFDKRTLLTYPREWQAQMFLIQGADGGILVQARDDGTQFKSLNITNDGENFCLDITTIPQAPFTQYESFDTVTWSVIAYEGDWMNGALLYKQYMEDVFHLSEINEREPEWASDIQLVWMDDVESKVELDLLAKEVNPAQTLIQIPGWRAAAYDTKYPDYTPGYGVVDLIDYAHSLGFKVSLHCNMLGCAFESEEWKNGISESACLDAYTQEVIEERYTAFGINYRFAQINQASTDWQDLMVEIYTKVVEETGADCIHLDQSLLCFNDGRGLVNNMTTMQGNVELQRKLAEALPGVAFSGEGINEYNMRYADFLQQHVYGLDNAKGSWSDDYFDQIVPLVTVLFSDYARGYHYPALPKADKSNTDLYLAWYRAGNARSGHIPCLYRETLGSLLKPSEVFKMVMEDARFCMEKKPIVELQPWDDGVVMSYILNDGTKAQWRQTDKHLAFYPNASVNEPTTVFVHGTETYETDRGLEDWIIYDEETLYGLRKDSSYMLSPTKRDNSVTHITNIDGNLTVKGFVTNDSYTAIALEEIIPPGRREIIFTDYEGAMRCGEVLFDGSHNETSEFDSKTSFWYTLPSQGQVRHLGETILFHPPWVDGVQAIGCTWMEADVPLDVVGTTTFVASFQLASAESAAGSDGVIYKVYAWDKADAEKTNVICKEVVCLSEKGLPVSLDLTQFEGGTVTIRIECYPGDTPGNDSCLVVAPRVIQNRGQDVRRVTYSVKTEKPVVELLSASGQATIEAGEENNYTITCGIDDVVWLLYKEQTDGNEVDLTKYPF